MAADMEKIEMLLMEHEERLEKTLSVFKNELLMVRRFLRHKTFSCCK